MVVSVIGIIPCLLQKGTAWGKHVASTCYGCFCNGDTTMDTNKMIIICMEKM